MSEIRYPDARSADEILRESESFFAGRGAVHTTLRSLVDRLKEESIPYAIVGGMALNLFGFVRQTVDVDILLTKVGLGTIPGAIRRTWLRARLSGRHARLSWMSTLVCGSIS